MQEGQPKDDDYHNSDDYSDDESDYSLLTDDDDDQEDTVDTVGRVMDSSDKPVTVVNKDAQPVAIQKPAPALPPPPEPDMTKAVR